MSNTFTNKKEILDHEYTSQIIHRASSEMYQATGNKLNWPDMRNDIIKRLIIAKYTKKQNTIDIS